MERFIACAAFQCTYAHIVGSTSSVTMEPPTLTGNSRRCEATRTGDVRFYYTGMAQGFLLDRLLPGWKARALGKGVYLDDLVEEAIRR